jgi:hypothetical protein
LGVSPIPKYPKQKESDSAPGMSQSLQRVWELPEIGIKHFLGVVILDGDRSYISLCRTAPVTTSLFDDHPTRSTE